MLFDLFRDPWTLVLVALRYLFGFGSWMGCWSHPVLEAPSLLQVAQPSVLGGLLSGPTATLQLSLLLFRLLTPEMLLIPLPPTIDLRPRLYALSITAMPLDRSSSRTILFTLLRPLANSL